MTYRINSVTSSSEEDPLNAFLFPQNPQSELYPEFSQMFENVRSNDLSFGPFYQMPKVSLGTSFDSSVNCSTLFKERVHQNSPLFELPPPLPSREEPVSKNVNKENYRIGLLLGSLVQDPYASLAFSVSPYTQETKQGLSNKEIDKVEKELAYKQGMVLPVIIGKTTRLVNESIIGYAKEQIDEFCSQNPLNEEICETVTQVGASSIESVISIVPETVKTLVKDVHHSYESQVKKSIQQLAEYGIEEQETRDFYSGVKDFGLITIIPSATKLVNSVKNFKRINYSKGYQNSIKECFSEVSEFKGKLTEDLTLVRYHSKKSSWSWFTSIADGNRYRTMDEVMDSLALLTTFGKRSYVSVAKIPSGTKVRFLYGTASEQVDRGIKEFRKGGGTQYRFYDFDPEWIVETRKIPSIDK